LIFFSVLARDWLEEQLRYDLFNTEWDVKSELSQSINIMLHFEV